MILTDEQIKAVFLKHYTKQYGEEAAKQLLEQLPDCEYGKEVAIEQDKQTRQDTLREVGEWMYQGYSGHESTVLGDAFDRVLAHFLQYKSILDDKQRK